MYRRCMRVPPGGLVLVLVGALVMAAGPAFAEKTDARKHYDRATAAFGLGKYADAAVEYEAAFRLRPDPALLYNCAQSYRLAGNRTRAIELYRNYLRLYGDAPNAEDARKHLANLELEVAAERTVPARPAPAGAAAAPVAAPTTPSPRPVPAPPAAAPAPVVAAAPPPAPVYSPPPPPPATPPPATAPPPLDAPPPAAPPAEVHVDVAVSGTPAPADDGDRPLVKRPWFWAAVGAVVVAGVVVAIVASSGDKDPNPSLGTVVGN
jgi:hypothetical protein